MCISAALLHAMTQTIAKAIEHQPPNIRLHTAQQEQPAHIKANPSQEKALPWATISRAVLGEV